MLTITYQTVDLLKGGVVEAIFCKIIDEPSYHADYDSISDKIFSTGLVDDIKSIRIFKGDLDDASKLVCEHTRYKPANNQIEYSKFDSWIESISKK